jgi:Matrixin
MKKSCLIRLAVLISACMLLSTNGWSYYFFVLYNTSTGPFNTPIAERFDLNALVNNTVPFFISDTGPALMAPGDSFPAIIGEIRGAAAVWNTVSTSKLRLAYGGLYTAGSASELSPGIDVEFTDEIPPGLVALGVPVVTGSLGYGSEGLIVPIIRSKIYLPNDLTNVYPYGDFPSYSEPFFVTLVHEFGHTMGLQHTLSSGVMSTLWTSASSKATPLGADDMAGISVLYPADGYLPTVGSISGHVMLGSTGLALASVVALSATNPAISILTNPDGSYRMDGVPPGLYSVYAQPLPPPEYGETTPDNIIYPTDVNGNSIGLNYNAFATQFFTAGGGATRNASLAYPVQVIAGLLTSGVEFQVSSRTSQAVYGVRTYGFSPTNVAVASPPIMTGLPLPSPVAATGQGLLNANNVILPGLSISVLGGAATASNLRPYPPPTPYIAVDVQANLGAGEGPKHLLFATPDNLYVLPAAFFLVANPPPSITAVTPSWDANGNRIVLISGTGFFPGETATTVPVNTTVLFDGLPGVISGTTNSGQLIVYPPPAQANYTATVTALNSDGQSSLFLNPTPLTFSYGGTATPAAIASPSLTVTPSILVAGTATTVNVVGANTGFIAGQTTVGFGTSDVVVTQVTVLSPTHLTVQVTPNVTVPTSGINVTTGLSVISQALGNNVTTQ